MLRRLLVPLVVLVFALTVPTAASAAPMLSRAQINRLVFIQQGSALAEVYSTISVPTGFHISAGQAMKIAEHTLRMRALHRRMHPLLVVPFVYRAQDPYWYVVFAYRGDIEGDVSVSKTGNVLGAWTGQQARAVWTHGGWADVLTNWMIYGAASLLFVLAFFDPRRLWSLRHLDALAVLSFLVSYLLLSGAHLEAAVWAAYPPMIYLLLRLLSIGFGRNNDRGGRIAPLLGLRTLIVGLPLVLAARIVISLLGHQEIDVGFESVIGASRVIHHLPIYYPDVNHGDTYGPITYLAYVPFTLIWPWSNPTSTPYAANFAAVFFDLMTVVGLIFLGRRFARGREGTRLGLLFAWAWAACPFSIIGLTVHTNDALVSMLSVIALLAISSPAVTGAVLGLAAAAKFSPAGLLPLLAAPRQRGRKGAAVCVGAFLVVVAAAILSWLPPQGLGYFWQRTLGFQLTRADVFSPWQLHPSLHPLQILIEVLAVGLVAVVAFLPRRRTLVQVAALAGAVTIAVQMPANHWYYYYIMWFLPFAVVALMGLERAAEPVTETLATEYVPEPQPVLAGA